MSSKNNSTQQIAPTFLACFGSSFESAVECEFVEDAKKFTSKKKTRWPNEEVPTPGKAKRCGLPRSRLSAWL